MSVLESRDFLVSKKNIPVLVAGICAIATSTPQHDINLLVVEHVD